MGRAVSAKRRQAVIEGMGDCQASVIRTNT